MMSSSSSSSSLPGTSGFAAAAAAAAEARPVVRKSMWTEEEDEKLREQVRRHGGPHNWDDICVALDGRTAKSCRLRWCQHLDPRVDALKPFTHEEDMLIVKYQADYGNRWSTIAEFLSGRTDNAIKNRWNSVLRKQHGQASTAKQVLPRQYWTPSALPRAAAGPPEVTPGCLPLFPLEKGDVRMEGGGPPLRPHTPEGDVSEDDTSAAPMELFPLAPGDIRTNAGAEDTPTQLKLAPAGRMVFDVLPLRAYRL